MKSLTLSTVFTAIDRMTGPVKTMTTSVTRLGKAGQIAGKVGSFALKAGAALAATSMVAGAAIGKAAASFAEKGDEIAKTARMLGMSTDALQELRYAAGMQGVEVAGLTQGFKLLNNNLGQLKIKQGSLYTTLARTNPQLAKQLASAKDTDEAFTMLMAALKAETDVQKRAALAQAAFGKSGQELIKFSEAGADGIATLRGEAHKYGLVIDHESALQSEAFSDSLSRLKQSALGLANQGLARVVEKFQPLLQRAADWIAANKEMLSMRLDQVFAAIERTAAALGPVFAALAPALKPLWELIQALLPAVEWIAKALTAVLTPVAQFLGGAFKNLAGLVNGDITMGDVRSSMDQFGALGDMGLATSPVSPNTGMIAATSSTSISRSMVDINIPNIPQGGSVRQTGAAPGVTLSTGRQMGGIQ